TGKPKGVVIEHRALVNRLNWMQKRYPLEKNDTILQKTPYTFDVSVWEMFWWGIEGARVCFLEPGGEKDPMIIADTIEKHRVTVLHFVPSMLTPFLEYIKQSGTVMKLAGLKQVIASGEALTRYQVRQFNHLLFKTHRTKLANLYGPTEASIDVTAFDCSTGETLEVIPIGKPIDNIRLYIVDNHFRLQPVGIAGELCIAGDGLARGYLNKPQLTRERFVENPYESEGKKLYRTADLAMWLPDGNIEFLGRIDHQVKIRGNRIELGEIENRLMHHPGIKEAIVLISHAGNHQENHSPELYLCAYIVADTALSTEDVRKHLSKKLPDYMIPGEFTNLDKLPLTPNGKIDRKALKEIKGTGLHTDVKYAPPRNAVERTLVEIWQNLLGKDNIGIDENFFQLGGDSIKCIQVVSQLNKVGYKCKINDLFNNPFISKFAPLVKKRDRVASQSVVTGDLRLSPIQEWFFENDFVNNYHYNQAVMLYSKEGFEKEAVRKVFRKISDHHDALRLSYKEVNGKHTLSNRGTDCQLLLREFDLRGRKDAAAELEDGVNKIQAGINLETGPMMNLGLFHLDDGGRLIIAIHHLAVDGISWRILFEDIEVLFHQYTKGEPLTLPLKTDSYKVWTERLARYADSPGFLKEKEYWKTLETMTFPPLEIDYKDTVTSVADNHTQSILLSETETGLLLTGVNNAFGTEINDILLTALGLAVKDVMGHNRFLIQLEGHGREEFLEDVDINRTVGWFTSMYPVVLDFSLTGSSENLSRFIKEVKESLHRVPGKGIGYGILKYLTSAEQKKDIDFKQKAQIVFNYLGQFDSDLQQLSFSIAKESSGMKQNQDQAREFELEVSALIAAKQLEISITFSKKQYKSETISQLLNSYKTSLNKIIAYCSTRETRELTPSDLSYHKLSIESVEDLSLKYPLENLYTLSPMQKGMLFYSIYENRDSGRKASAYLNQQAYRLHGHLDEVLVEKSLNELLKRYDILRTAFIYEGFDPPLQLVLKERQVDFYYRDLVGSDVGNREEKESWIREYTEKDRLRTFDLSRDVLMRVAVLKVGDSEYEFIWTHHHILMDGWCLGIIISEFFEIYNACLENRTSQLPGITPYSSYIQWLDKQDKKKGLSYWREYLDGYRQEAGLPQSMWQAGDSDYELQTFEFKVDESSTRRLERVARENKVTVNTIIQAIWGILLTRYNNSDDVVFGAVVSGRPPEIDGIESMMGLFINTVPVRIRIKENMYFSKLLEEVMEKNTKSQAYEYLPLAEIQEKSLLKRKLIDHIIVFQNFPGQHTGKEAPVKGFNVEHVEYFAPINYNLSIVVTPGKTLSMLFKYNSLVYENDLIEEISRTLQLIISDVVDRPDIKVAGIRSESQIEANELMAQFSVDLEDI
ncbi:MAG: AMP-binding protein, partial [bacterium]|nr:AMP-binding protein [bacterium]